MSDAITLGELRRINCVLLRYLPEFLDIERRRGTETGEHRVVPTEVPPVRVYELIEGVDGLGFDLGVRFPFRKFSAAHDEHLAPLIRFHEFLYELLPNRTCSTEDNRLSPAVLIGILNSLLQR